MAERHISLPKLFSSGDVKNGSSGLKFVRELTDGRRERKGRSYPRYLKEKPLQFG